MYKPKPLILLLINDDISDEVNDIVVLLPTARSKGSYSNCSPTATVTITYKTTVSE